MKSKNIIKIVTGTIIATTIISPVVPVIQNISVLADTTNSNSSNSYTHSKFCIRSLRVWSLIRYLLKFK